MVQSKRRIVRRKWDEWYEDAKRYYEQHGDLLVPMKYVTPEGYRLGQWVYCMRQRYRGAPRTAPLYGNEIAMLEQIGMVWRLRKRPNWDEWLDMAASYYREHGDLLVPTQYVTPGGYHLGPWINSMRQKYKGNDDGPPLTERQIHALEAYGMVWEINDCPQWEGWLSLAESYYREHGDLLVPEGCRPGGHHLDEWISGLRMKYRKGLLSEDQIADVERLGMVWEPGRIHPWEEYIEAAARYFRENGNLLVPADYITPEGLTLGKWIAMQRSLYNHPGEYTGKKPLSGERIQRLEALGMVWNAKECQWLEMFGSVRKHLRTYGKLPGRGVFEAGSGGRDLGVWLAAQRERIRDGTMPLNRAKLLEEMLEEIGISEESIRKTERQKEERNTVCGCCSEPERTPVFSQLYPTEPGKNNTSGVVGVEWVDRKKRWKASIQVKRQTYGLGMFQSIESASYARKSAEKVLQAVMRGERETDELWNRMFAWLSEYQESNIFPPRKGERVETPDGRDLSDWMYCQQFLLRIGFLEEDRAEQLRTIRIGIPDEMKVWEWDRMLAWIAQYKSDFGHLPVNRSIVAPNGRKPSSWIATQRRQAKKGELSPSQSERLKSAGIL